MGNFTYPTDNIVIIAPIVFIVFMVLFPLIGLKYGWRKATFWGVGNFAMYAIGLVIWTIFGTTICEKLSQLIYKFLPQLEGLDPTQLLKSILAPIFLLLIILFGNLILLINYAIWAKRAFGIKKEGRVNKLIKNRKKELKEAGKEVPAQITVKLQNGDVVTERSKGRKAINRVSGLLIMPAAMFPISVSMTSFVYFATTNKTTRTNNAFAGSIYKFLNDMDTKIPWASYYKGNTGADYNVVLTALPHLSEKITLKIHDATICDEKTKEMPVKSTATSDLMTFITTDLIQAIQQFSASFKNFSKDAFADTYEKAFEPAAKSEAERVYPIAYQEAIDAGKTPEEAQEIATEAAKTAGKAAGKAAGREATTPMAQEQINKFNYLADVWNVITTQFKDLFDSIMQSDNAIDLVAQAVEKLKLEQITISKENIDNLFGPYDEKTKQRDAAKGVFDDIHNGYNNAKQKEEGWPNRNIPITYKIVYKEGEKEIEEEDTINVFAIYLNHIDCNKRFKEVFQGVLSTMFTFADDVTEEGKTTFQEKLMLVSGAFLNCTEE